MEKLPDFVIIPYQLLVDKKVRSIDRVLYGVIYWFTKLKNESCTASNPTLAKLAKTTARTVQNSLTRLEFCGYIKREYFDEESHHRKEIVPTISFSYLSPTDDSLSSGDDRAVIKRTRGLSSTGDHNKNTKNKNTIKRIINKKTSLAKSTNVDSAGDEINGIIGLFREVNPTYEQLFCRPVERAAAGRLLKKWNFDQIKAVVGVLPRLNADKYAKGKSITPSEFERNLGYIKAFIDQSRGHKLNVIKI